MQPRTIAGRYEVERAVGRGGMGTVWLCRDTVLDREVAVKEVGGLPGASTSDLARALREARSSAALNHRNVVSVYDAVEDGDRNWLVMEYIPSRNLSELIAEEGPLPPERVARIGAQAADGLAAAHERGTVHRDVKPGNLLVTDGDLVKVSDFGIARTHGEEQLTRSGIVTGTPAFFAPEIARGEDPTSAADVWALGASLYAAVEGRLPYPDTENAIALLTRIASEPPPRPERAGFLTEAIERMMDPDRSTRWTMTDAAHTLHRLAEQHADRESGPSTVSLTAPVGEDVADDRLEPDADQTPVTPAPPPPATSDERGPGRRRGAMAALGVLAALVAAIALVLVLDRDDQEPSASDDPTSSATETSQDSEEGSSATSGGQGRDSGPSAETEPAAFVEEYYAHLPDDPRTSWALLSSDMQDEVGGYDSYAGFWRTISEVRADATAVDDAVVEVEVTYRSDSGTETETRRITVEPAGDAFEIVGDEVA